MTPGLLGLTSITGGVGMGIRIGQFLNGDGFSKFEHAFVALGDGNILEAEPGGARIVPFHYADRDVYWCHNILKLLPATVTAEQVQELARGYRGVEYSFLDYDALVAHRLHLPIPGLQHFIRDTGHMICSQLDDDFYKRLRARIFTDDRWEGYVTPGMLYNRDLELGK